MSEAFDDKIKTYKDNTDNHLQNWKKIKAIENFSKVHADIAVWEELELLVRFYHKGYLWPSQQQLLDDILAHYKIDYTKWAVKDGWVKMQLFNGFKQKKQHTQLEFWFLDLEKKLVEGREKRAFYSKLERHKLIQPRLI